MIGRALAEHDDEPDKLEAARSHFEQALKLIQTTLPRWLVSRRWRATITAISIHSQFTWSAPISLLNGRSPPHRIWSRRGLRLVMLTAGNTNTQSRGSPPGSHPVGPGKFACLGLAFVGPCLRDTA